jgi:hypothetical protein
MGFFPSKSVPDSEYLLIRSTLEANMAANASTEQAAVAHHRIASCYLAKLFGKQSTEALDGKVSSRADVTAHRCAIGPVQPRFSDLTAVPENDELTRLLHSIP